MKEDLEKMDCTRSRLIRVIGLCKENVTNKQSAGIIQATIVSSMDQTGASDEWVFVHCCLVFMIITLVLSLSVYFYSRDEVSYPMTEHNGHVDYIRIQHVTHVNSIYNKELGLTSDAYHIHNR